VRARIKRLITEMPGTARNHGKPARTKGMKRETRKKMLANVNLGGDLKMLAQEGRVVVIGSRGDATITRATDEPPRNRCGRSRVRQRSPAKPRKSNAGLYAGLENGTLRPGGG